MSYSSSLETVNNFGPDYVSYFSKLTKFSENFLVQLDMAQLNSKINLMVKYLYINLILVQSQRNLSYLNLILR